MAFGTQFSLDVNAELHKTTVQEFGEDQLWDNLDAFWEAHNTLFAMVADQIGERTTDRERVYGGTAEVDTQELDEFGQPSAQKMAIPGYNVGFPLRRYGNALQWTRIAFENMTVEEFQRQVNAIADADQTNLERQLRRAFFGPSNYTFVDWQEMPKINLSVKALLNADSSVIPDGPYGKTFDGTTHTHYLGVATQDTPLQSEVVALIDTVVEHFTTGAMHLYINRAEETKVRGFTDFKPYIDARLIDNRAQLLTTSPLDISNIYDRAIGLLEGAEVFVKPWVPAGYMVAVHQGTNRPLVVREPKPAVQRGLRIVAQDENHPLRATEWEHRFGVGIWNRAGAAVLDTKTGTATYSAPALI